MILLAAVVVFLAMASSAQAFGELSQKPGEAGCLSLTGAEGCKPATAIDGANDVAVSPDGRHVYVSSFFSDAVAVFSRDPVTGALSQRPGAEGCIANGGAGGCAPARVLDGPVSVAVSPDGRNVYAASFEPDAVAVFSRDPATGALSQSMELSGCVSQNGAGGCRAAPALDGPIGIAVVANGTDVYVPSVLSDSITVFDRDPATGALTQVGCISETGGACVDGVGLLGVRDISVSPDSANVYVTALDSDAVAVFDRDPGAGALTQQPGVALDSPNVIATSPDGASVYVMTNPTANSTALVVFDRDFSGGLTQKPGSAGCFSPVGSGTSCEPARGMEDVADVTVSPDGADVYAAGTDSLLSFGRDSAGALTQKPGLLGCFSSDGSEGVCAVGRGLAAIEKGLAISPDGRSIYVTATEFDTVAIFDRATPPPADTVAPAVSGFRLAPKRFRPGPKRGSRFHFRLSEPAGVRIAVERARPGRRVGKRCKPATPKLAKRRPCKRFVPRASLRFSGRAAGQNTIRFSGRIGKRGLRPGAYRATIVATDAAGNRSAPRRAPFAVLAAKPQRR